MHTFRFQIFKGKHSKGEKGKKLVKGDKHGRAKQKTSKEEGQPSTSREFHGFRRPQEVKKSKKRVSFKDPLEHETSKDKQSHRVSKGKVTESSLAVANEYVELELCQDSMPTFTNHSNCQHHHGWCVARNWQGTSTQYKYTFFQVVLEKTVLRDTTIEDSGSEESTYSSGSDQTDTTVSDSDAEVHSSDEDSSTTESED